MHRDQSDPRSLFYRDQRSSILLWETLILVAGKEVSPVSKGAIGNRPVGDLRLFGQAIITSMITREVETVTADRALLYQTLKMNYSLNDWREPHLSIRVDPRTKHQGSSIALDSRSQDGQMSWSLPESAQRIPLSHRSPSLTDSEVQLGQNRGHSLAHSVPRQAPSLWPGSEPLVHSFTGKTAGRRAHALIIPPPIHRELLLLSYSAPKVAPDVLAASGLATVKIRRQHSVAWSWSRHL